MIYVCTLLYLFKNYLSIKNTTVEQQLIDHEVANCCIHFNHHRLRLRFRWGCLPSLFYLFSFKTLFT